MCLTRSITQTDMSVIYFCFLYILDICLLTVNVFAPQFNFWSIITLFLNLVGLATYFTFLTCYYVMTQHNQILDGFFSEATSLTYLLDTNDKEHDNEAQIIKHSAYYGETEFSKLLSKNAGLTILSVNIQCIDTKLDDFESFINSMNLTNSISVICLQDCWLKETDNVSMFNLT